MINERLGPYQIVSKLGEGGMGVVYRARDTQLNRDVAIKVLPDAFALDTERLARFTREAQVLASLNHPSIAQIHGFEGGSPAQAGRYLIMELVDGEDLSERIRRGAIPVDEALPLARQIAEALEAAHEQGIIHRDLKPANIKVRGDGTVKVLDFGLAKAVEPGAESRQPGADLANSPTITSPAMTMRGVILGTAAYMSPEQAKGKVVDKRADIWAFGAVLYEMLTGARAFRGDDASETLAAVIRDRPDLSLLPASTPAQVRTLIERCLERDVKRRLRDIGEARVVLSDPVEPEAPSAATPSRSPVVPWVMTATVAIAAAVSIAMWAPWRSAAVPQVMRFSVLPSPPVVQGTAPFNAVAVSRDGRLVAYVSEGGGLVIRPIDQLEGQPLPGIGNVRAPFFSPDGQWVGYFEGPLVMKKVAVSGGPAITLCTCGGVPRGASWGDDHTIVFASAATDTGLWSVPDSGGEPTLLSRPDATHGEIDHLHPFILPGSRSVLFTVSARPIADSQIAVFDLATGTSKLVARGGSHPVYVDPGVIIYSASGALFAVRFDPTRLEVIGSPVPVTEQVAAVSNLAAHYGISTTGTMVYAPGRFRSQEISTQELVWIDRRGRTTPVNGAPARAYHMLRLSPDGTRVALGIRDEENDVWVWDLARETMSRLTVDPGFDTDAVWSPDGRRIAFSGTQGGAVASIFWQAANGMGTPERLTPAGGSPTSFSPDGRFLVFRADGGLHTLAMESRQASALLKTQSGDRGGELSPDGRFLAYEWTQSNTTQIYVQPFPNVDGGRWQVSQGGGRKPAWAANGRELFYIGASGGLYSVPVQATTAGFSSGSPTRLFDLTDLGNSYNGRPYDSTRDGKQFIALRNVEAQAEHTAQPLVVVVNWIEEVKARLGIAR